MMMDEVCIWYDIEAILLRPTYTWQTKTNQGSDIAKGRKANTVDPPKLIENKIIIHHELQMS